MARRGVEQHPMILSSPLSDIEIFMNFSQMLPHYIGSFGKEVIACSKTSFFCVMR